MAIKQPHLITVEKANQELLLSSELNSCPGRLPGFPTVPAIRLVQAVQSVRVAQEVQAAQVVRVGQEALAVRFVRRDQPPLSRLRGRPLPEVRQVPQRRVDQLHREVQRGQLHPVLPVAPPPLVVQRDQQARLPPVDPADRRVPARLEGLADPALLVVPQALEVQAVRVVLQVLAPVRSTKRPPQSETLRKLG